METLYERVKDKSLMWNYIKEAKSEKVKVFVWGTGEIGCGVGYKLLQKLNIEIDLYCDSDSKKWGNVIKNDIICVPPEIMKKFSDMICFVLVGGSNVIEIYRKLQDMGISRFVTFEELSTTDIFFKRLFSVYEEITNGNLYMYYWEL